MSGAFKLSVAGLLRRRDGYLALVVWSDGVREWGERVGPFQSAEQLALWLDDLGRETIEVLAPEAFGLPGEIRRLRSPDEHAECCFRALDSQVRGSSP